MELKLGMGTRYGTFAGRRKGMNRKTLNLSVVAGGMADEMLDRLA
jgi:hypothetical protein